MLEVEWYADEQATEELTADSVVNPGDAFYVVVLFSEAVQYNIANDDTARPALFTIANNVSIRLRVVASVANGNAFRNESAKPFSEYSGRDRFICKMIAD